MLVHVFSGCMDNGSYDINVEETVILKRLITYESGDVNWWRKGDSFSFSRGKSKLIE